ncbi:MAG: hypothetical protein V1663_01630 [archaeon]
MLKRIISKIILTGTILHLLSYNFNLKLDRDLNQISRQGSSKGELETIVQKEDHETITIDAKIKAVSVDLGNPADQRIFVGYFKNYTDSVYSFRSNDFSIPLLSDENDFDVDQIIKHASSNSQKLDSILKDTRFIHFSGHHHVFRSYVYGTTEKKGKEYVNSAVDLTNLSVHPETEVIFLNMCSSVSKYRTFTENLMKIFPNAILLGYDLRSAPDEVNSRLLKEFFKKLSSKSDKPIIGFSKREIAEFWIDSTIKIYHKERREGHYRVLKAIWPEDNTIYELSSRGNTLKRYELETGYPIE